MARTRAPATHCVHRWAQNTDPHKSGRTGNRRYDGMSYYLYATVMAVKYPKQGVVVVAADGVRDSMTTTAERHRIFNALPPDLRVLLQRELPQLERTSWAAAERDTADGVACNSGAPQCGLPRKGRMVALQPSAQDVQKSREIFESVILPRWLQRCSVDCAAVWNQTIGPVRNMRVPAAR